jgi:hypothetical protein
MIELFNGIFTDDRMLVLCLTAIPLVIMGAYFRKDAVFGFLVFPLILDVILYTALVLNIEPFDSSPEARIALSRPALASMLISLCIIAVNGHLNVFFFRIYKWTTKFFKR